MSSYNKCREIEDESMAMALAYLKFLDDDSKIFMTQDHEFLQAIYGDIIAKFSSGSISTIELKAETSNDYGNLFLESWSNRAKTNPGWMLKCRARHLWYYFIDQDELYTMQFAELRDWAFMQHGITDYPEKPQKRHQQLNDTWGWCVPITTLQSSLKSFKTYYPQDDMKKSIDVKPVVRPIRLPDPTSPNFGQPARAN